MARAGSAGAPPGGARPSTGEAVRTVLAGVRERGWQHLLELVLVSVLWFVCLLATISVAAVPTILHKGGGILVAAAFALLPLLFVGPGTVGLFTAVDAIWSGENNGPFDALRSFFRGFRRRYLRSVGLGAFWALVLVSIYANVAEDRHLLPAFLLLGVAILLLYLVLFFLMVNTYLIPMLAVSDLSLWRALRLAVWESVANPVFTVLMLLGPLVVLIAGLVVRALFPLLLGGGLAMFATAALRFAPLRHPGLPELAVFDAPLDDDADPGGSAG